MSIEARSNRRYVPPRRVVPPDSTPRFAARRNLLHLSSSGWDLHVDDVRAEPELTALISADACWLLASQDWVSRRPRRWQGRAWRSWRKEEAALAAEQDGLVRASFARPSLRPQSSA
jgi:hypothetical protein